nr:SHOCT domain-containing protein [Microbacterium bovistercoris]
MSTPAGWYPNGDDWETYWDGTSWTDQNRSRGAAAVADSEESTDADLQKGDGVNAPLLNFTSHIDGKNARVQVWLDRVEWDWQGRMGAGAKAGLAVMTFGASYAATGFGRKKSSESIPIRSIMSVTTKKGKGFQTVLQVITAGNTIDMRISHKEADVVKTTLSQLLNGSHPAQQTRVTQAVPAPPVAAAVPSVDVAAQLQQLASLRDAGILTEDEFVAKKTELLSRI